jgi:hypothetical protein
VSRACQRTNESERAEELHGDFLAAKKDCLMGGGGRYLMATY